LAIVLKQFILEIILLSFKGLYMISGSIVAMVTPFKDGQVDLSAIQSLVQWHIAQGTQGLVLCGSTGEGLLLSLDEWKSVLQVAKSQSDDQIPLIAGISQSNPSVAMEYILAAEEINVDGVLIVAPYYVRPTQAGLYHYYKHLHDNSQIPIIIYNHPYRCAVSIDVSTIVELSKLPRIVGLKDSSEDLSRLHVLKSALHPSFVLLAGDDTFMEDYLNQGGHGMISMVGNIAPQLCRRIADGVGDSTLLKQMVNALQVGPNPVPIKAAMSILELCDEDVKLPLVPLSLEEKTTMHGILSQLFLVGQQVA
jgi:4-hydroxy-tetrahydrodipicolinate synthase